MIVWKVRNDISVSSLSKIFDRLKHTDNVAIRVLILGPNEVYLDPQWKSSHPTGYTEYREPSFQDLVEIREVYLRDLIGAGWLKEVTI